MSKRKKEVSVKQFITLLQKCSVTHLPGQISAVLEDQMVPYALETLQSIAVSNTPQLRNKHSEESHQLYNFTCI